MNLLSFANKMRRLTFSLRGLDCCIGRERRRSMTEPDVIARVASCSSSNTAPRLSTRVPLQNERQLSPKGVTEIVLPSLESLPVEIQIAILAESSLESLRALIKSSPRFYQVYFRNETSILNNSLKRTLGGIFHDAYAASWSDQGSAELGAAASAMRFSFEDYLESMRTDRTVTGSTADNVPLEAAQKMAHFHLRVVEPLTERYARWALGALSSSPDAAPLTRTEKARIQRGVYRLQIICNMFLRGNRMILGVLDCFGPWQSEEKVCVHAFAMERYSSVFIDCAWQLDQERNPKYRRIPLWNVNERLLLYSYDSESTPHSSNRAQSSSLTYRVVINREALATVLSLGLPVLRETFEARKSVELAEVVEKSIGVGDWVYGWHWIDSAGKQPRVDISAMMSHCSHHIRLIGEAVLISFSRIFPSRT